MGSLFRLTASPLASTSSSSGLLVYTDMLTGFSGTITFLDTEIAQILYVQFLNLLTNEAVEVSYTVTSFSTLTYNSNVDLTSHQVIIKGV